MFLFFFLMELRQSSDLFSCSTLRDTILSELKCSQESKSAVYNSVSLAFIPFFTFSSHTLLCLLSLLVTFSPYREKAREKRLHDKLITHKAEAFSFHLFTSASWTKQNRTHEKWEFIYLESGSTLLALKKRDKNVVTM